MLSLVSTWMGDHLGRNTSVGVLSLCLVIVHRPLIWIWGTDAIHLYLGNELQGWKDAECSVGSAETTLNGGMPILMLVCIRWNPNYLPFYINYLNLQCMQSVFYPLCLEIFWKPHKCTFSALNTFLHLSGPQNNLITGNKISFFGSHPIRFEGSGEKEKICRNCHLQRWRLHHFRARAHQIYISQVQNSNKSCNFLLLGRLGRTGQYWKVLPFFYSILSCFHEQNIYKILFFVDCSVRTKRLIDINVKKVQICSKVYFFGSK